METEEKVNKTLDFINRDRVLADDPYFSARLMARAGYEFSHRKGSAGLSPVFMRLRPVLAIAVILLAIIAGMFLGTRLGKEPATLQTADRSSRLQRLAQEEFITEINGSVEETLLSKK